MEAQGEVGQVLKLPDGGKVEAQVEVSQMIPWICLNAQLQVSDG